MASLALTRWRTLAATTVLLVSASVSASCARSPAPPDRFVGTWRLVSMTSMESSGEERDLWGKEPKGLLTYAPGGRMSAVITAASRTLPGTGSAPGSSDEQAMLFRTSVAYAGRYSLTDTGVVHHVEVASDPALVGKDQVRVVRFEGNRITVTGPPLRTVGGPGEKALQLVWERVE